MSVKTKIPFLCTANSCRSQMAEGFLRHHHKDRFNVYSAGAKPTLVHPLTVHVMAEMGIDISKQSSKSIREFFSLDFGYVITLCGEDAKDLCPVFPGRARTRLHWDFADPAQAEGKQKEVVEVFRKIRDEINTKIDQFVKELEKERKPWVTCSVIRRKY